MLGARPGGPGAAEAPEPRQVREEAAVRRPLWVPPINLPGAFNYPMKNTPPVCDYTESDYQKSFWDQGARAYEDAAEAIALKRLLPSDGNLLLELGAGAGRNTTRYTGYKRVVLVDYSRTQLEQAQKRLGRSNQYVYVAADAYRLPFVEGLFDGATMIRTLHHMADPSMALGQVFSVLGKNAIFILEYANKHNLKAILRYFLKMQTWSPYTEESVEFARLNYDFHPRAVQHWLTENKFVVEKTLTVSHFRAGFLKRWLPAMFLAVMDGLFQPSGAWFQLTPSVFLKARVADKKAPVKPNAFFKCLDCGRGLPQFSGAMRCPGCGHVWEQEEGIYDFRTAE
jgi:ubiquinone/menaquinone biosynthesis C-methylase UbiE